MNMNIDDMLKARLLAYVNSFALFHKCGCTVQTRYIGNL